VSGHLPLSAQAYFCDTRSPLSAVADSGFTNGGKDEAPQAPRGGCGRGKWFWISK